MSTLNCALVGLVTAVLACALMHCMYRERESSSRARRDDPFAFRSTIEENKKKYKSSRDVHEDNWQESFATGEEESEPFDAGMVNQWRKDKVAPALGDDSPFTWQADESECSVSSLKAPSKEHARAGANTSPERTAHYSSDRARARIIGQSPNAALRPQSVLKIHADTPIVFGDSGMRQMYINEHNHCFDKGENASACCFDRSC